MRSLWTSFYEVSDAPHVALENFLKIYQQLAKTRKII